MKKEVLTYEKAMSQLEIIVQEIESGETSIDQLSNKLKEAQKLISFCKNKLQKTQDNVNKLLEKDFPE